MNFSITSDNTCSLVKGDTDYSGDIQIPASVEIDGKTYTVTSIGDAAFLKCEALTSVEIPDTVTSIGECAFYGCRALASIEIPSSVTSIGTYAFLCFGRLESVTIHSPNPITAFDREYPFQKTVLFDSHVSSCTLYVPKGSKALYQNNSEWCGFGDIQELE